MTFIEIPPEIEQKLKIIFDTNYEIAVWFLAHHKENKLRIEKFLHSPLGHKMHVSPLSVSIDECVNFVKDHTEYELISGHLHSRAYGNIIKPFDPYWTITVKEGNFFPGDIIDGRFYVSKKYIAGQEGGDSHGIARLAEFGIARGINLTKTLFVHPRYGSEGKEMCPDLVDIHAYEVAPSQRFKVNELSVIVR